MKRVDCKTYVKKVQRRANALFREHNEGLKQDELWLGRFYMRQVRRDVVPFEDGSGAVVNFIVEFGDKKTGKRDLESFTNFDLHISDHKGYASWKLFWAMNDFIIKTCKVWDEEPRPSIHNALDYRLVPPLPPLKLKYQLDNYS